MTVQEIFETMDYGPAPESAAAAQEWLERSGRAFGHFIGGQMTAHAGGLDSRNPADGSHLASLSQADAAAIDAAVAAARKAQADWAADGARRGRVLYAMARLVQKHARLLAVLETLENGKPIRESRDIDIPLVARHFYYHAGLARLMEDEMPAQRPHGVCGQIIPWNFPLLMLAWKVAPALAAGNTVVLKPAEYTSLTALFMAEICTQAGVPPGVVNIVTGDGRVGEMIVAHEGIDKIAFTGSTEVGRRIREATAGTGKALTLELGGKSPYIVFDDADLDSAVEGLVDAIWFNQGQVCCAGSRLLVQEGVAERFHDKLRRRMDGLRLGDPLDKCIDVGAMVDPAQLERVSRMVSEGLEADPGAEVHRTGAALPDGGCFYPPTLITGLHPASPLMQDEIFGPVLVGTTFRTPAEAVALANNSRYGLAATVWSENLNLALDVAPKLAAGVVWINATNLFDAAAPFGGLRESGFGREGGPEGLAAYTRPRAEATELSRLRPVEAPAKGAAPSDGLLDRTAKNLVGGKQARPDSGYSTPVWSPDGRLLGHVGQGNAKDIRNAVEAAGTAGAWSRSTGHGRAQILYYLAENLAAREAEFATRLRDLGQVDADGAAAEVAASVDRLFTAAAWADKFDGRAAGVPLRGMALALREPVGVIGALCADEAPLLGFVTVLGAILATGSRAVLIPSEAAPLAAMDLMQVIETSDVPAGVVNIIAGRHEDLAAPLAGHMDVQAVWSFSSSDLSEGIERASAADLKRTWVNHGRGLDWHAPAGGLKPFLEQATEVKTVWVPYGE